MRPVFYITGVPGVGKSTLCRELVKRSPKRFEHCSFGQLIAAELVAQGEDADEVRLRQQSRSLVTPTILSRASAQLFAAIKQQTSCSLLLDSHAVSQSGAVLYATPDGPSFFGQVRYGAIVHLFASAKTVLLRSDAKRTGRQAKRASDVHSHDMLQRAVSVVYASQSSCPAYFVEAERSIAKVADTVEDLLRRHVE